MEELVLELDPMQTQGMQETLQHIHHEQHSQGSSSKDTVTDKSGKPIEVERGKHGLLPEHSGELGVSKGQCPKTEVGSSVGDHTKDKLNGLNGLVDDNLSHAMILVFVLIGRVMVCGHLLGQKVRLGEQENGDGNTSNGKKKVLHTSLAIVHGLIDISGSQRNVDQSSNKVGRLASITRPAKVQRTLVHRVVIALADISPRGAGTITTAIALGPDSRLTIVSLLVIGTAPPVRGGVKARGAQHP
mmetsp:Transcript_18011/g.38899  ORF Transcript_18011/g.38899 Transcript_18011/m.38899 type:complete len:244 (+) Transcript_18011:163-894(+)